MIPLMPPLDHYVEPFGGSAAVLLNRPPAAGREIYSDMNAPMVSLLSEVRDDAERLVWRLRFTPYSRRGYMEAKARLKGGADAAIAHERGLNGKLGWSRSALAMRVDGNPRISPADTSAIRQVVAADAQSLREQGFNSKDGWNAKINPVSEGRSKVSSNRQGVAVDADTVVEQAMMSSQNGGWRSNRTPKPQANPIAARHGVGAEAADVAVTTGASMCGTQNGFGKAVDGGKRESVAVANASRQGVDVQQMHAHGVFGKPGYFGTVIDPNTHPQSVSESNRQGVPHSKDNVVLPPGWNAQPAGYVIPIDGRDGIEILLSYPPTKCETVCDESGLIYDLFYAARERPRALLLAGVESVQSVADAIALSQTVLSADYGHVDTDELDPLPSWRQIANTWYGAMLWRLKRAQVEDKTPDEVRDAYTHETSAMLTERSGRGEFLGYCAPMEETPLYRVGQRIAAVETYCANALDVIAEWRDCADALIYLDPPYVHSTRKGASDYEHEMDDQMHLDMLALVKDAKAHIIISGYASSLYDDFLDDWHRIVWDDVISSAAVGKNGKGKDNGRAEREEVVWLNYDINSWRVQQGSLF